METILDAESPEVQINYAGFWPRLWALLLDGLILSVVTLPFGLYNALEWKNTPLMVVSTLVALAYKPIMESVYGATLGKMALGLKVVGKEYEKATTGEVLLRDSINILSGLISLVMSVMIFQSEDFYSVTSYMEYSQFAGEHSSGIVSYVTGAFYIAELIVMLTDDRKRSIHDRIGGTYVIRK